MRDGIEAERNLHGFFMAYLSLNSYYYTMPELKLSHGYCDFFLLPDLTHYATRHCYITELKVLPKSEYNATSKDGATGKDGATTKAEAQWQEAARQICRYAAAPRIKALRQGTTLHKIIMQLEGWDPRRMEEMECPPAKATTMKPPPGKKEMKICYNTGVENINLSISSKK